MISLVDIAKQYGGEYLFRDLSLRIGDDERVAVVGANGAGKSTLMKIILGIIEPDAGEIVRSRSNTVGYLPQDGVAHAGRTLFDEAASAFDDLMALHARADGLAGEIEALAVAGKGESPELRDLVDELGRIQHHLEHREGYGIKTRVEQVLSGLGFRESDLGRATDEFSGGWQMRLALAKLLLREPTILMLDEPTNHLDLESLEWIEEYLQAYQGSVVLISHDRRFLDTLTRRTVEISLGKISEYKGNYSYYLKEKESRMEILRSQYENQQEKIKATMDFVDRFRYKATKARQVQSRLRAIEKMELVELVDQESGISFEFPRPPAPGRVLLRIEHLRKAYGELEVFDDLALTLERGDRVAFLGVNGAGKSTLARVIAGLEPFQAGSRAEGHNVIISYYAQHQAEDLDPGKTVLETLEQAARGDVRTRLRTLLGCFLFTGDDVFKQVAVLSGGEKSRLALAKMLLTPANLLVLDEPTNHLDLRSKGVLQEALARFEGSYVIVSHDRDFLEPLINKVAEFKDGRLRLHLGTISRYLERVHGERQAALKPPRPPAPEAAAGPSGRIEKERRREEAARRQQRSRKEKPLRDAIRRTEEKIAAAEARKAEVEAALASAGSYAGPDRARTLSHEYKEVTTTLAYLYDEWARRQEELERLA
jgi:ATP-binding cassette subfamily F protein 3